MFAVISFSVPLVSIFFNMGCSCLAVKAWVVLLGEFSQCKYSILSSEQTCATAGRLPPCSCPIPHSKLLLLVAMY